MTERRASPVGSKQVAASGQVREKQTAFLFRSFDSKVIIVLTVYFILFHFYFLSSFQLPDRTSLVPVSNHNANSPSLPRYYYYPAIVIQLYIYNVPPTAPTLRLRY